MRKSNVMCLYLHCFDSLSKMTTPTIWKIIPVNTGQNNVIHTAR